MKTVKATREGLIGSESASGYIIDKVVPFVALPSVNALGKFVRVTNPLNNKSTIAIVLDVGPWNEHDDSYVFGASRPMSEDGWRIIYKDYKEDIKELVRDNKTNKAGIDLGEKVWKLLDMKDNTDVTWEFIS